MWVWGLLLAKEVIFKYSKEDWLDHEMPTEIVEGRVPIPQTTFIRGKRFIIFCLFVWWNGDRCDILSVYVRRFIRVHSLAFRVVVVRG